MAKDSKIAEEQRELVQQKEGGEILKEQIQMALTEYRRHNKALFLSAFSGGLEIGFSLLLMATLYTMFIDETTASNLNILLGFAYPIGFIFVILGRSELFTEHTNLAVLPVLNGSVRIINLLELWGIIFIGNLIGGYLFSIILTQMGPAMGMITLESLYYFAHKMVQYSWPITLGSAIFAGWLMGLLSWLVTSSKDSISRIFVIILVTAIIGICGLHHSIVGSVEVFSGMIVDKRITLTDYLHFQVFATLGNIVGGTVFVAIVKYSHLGNTNLISSHLRKRKAGK
ncbi:formate/nitrite transporter family protein [Catalinimonas niigatensis]|uniref:formate/nitrite transporter family protein n=1 Tax=Catalinimonas niigatensis TaxID=1397264 RepID=UPI002666FBEC|nr:formate/nitrite transporter family protein [Catalinimonas niigatensis]WPP52855.1 formate/nitrite transporter family protein [Catalinimonas niigatensis]